MNPNAHNLVAAIEALLFIYGEPLEIAKIAKYLGADVHMVDEGLRYLESKLAMEERGLTLVRHNQRIQLVTKPEFALMTEQLTKEEFVEDLTPAALETLSIVIYAGPIPRADIEYIRGVNSSFILRNLLMRGLVERETDPARANAFLYRPTFDLLKRLGVSKVEDLPDAHKYKELVKTLYAEIQPPPAESH